MPIIGLTDNAPAFPRIGELRKGGEKTDPKRPGLDLNYFRFTSKLPDVTAKFASIYGNQPQAVNVFLPYDTTDENFEAWQEEWIAGGLVHRCDGQHITVQREGSTYVTLSQVEPWPCPYFSGQKQRTKQNPGCKQVGRLKVIIPELGRLAYVVALTTSIWDISEIHANLKAYEALRGSLRGIPFVFSRVPRMISTPSGNGRARREKWLWHIEADAQWVQAQLSVMQRQALPSGARLTLPSGEIVDNETGEIVEPDIDEVVGISPSTEPSAIELAQPNRLKALHAAGSSYYDEDWKEKRGELADKVSKGRTKSSKELSVDEVERLITGIREKAEETPETIETPDQAPPAAPSLFDSDNGAYAE